MCKFASILRQPSLVTLLLLACTVHTRAEQIDRIIFIGDSITEHSPSVEKLGWHGNYGMAASSIENDYVHLFVSRLAADQGVKPAILVYASGGGTLSGQMKFLDQFSEAEVQMAVVQMGENDRLKGDGSEFLNKYERILDAIPP